MRAIVLVILATVVVCASPGDAAQKRAKPKDQGPPIKVRVWTAQAATGEPSEDERGRLDSVRDLVDALRKRSRLMIVDDAAEAQVSVEILNREEHDSGQGGFGGSKVTPFRSTILRTRVQAGSQSSELKGNGSGSWSAAAKDAADRVDAWISSHHIGRHP